MVKRETILNNTMTGDKVVPLIISRDNMLDIDYIDDITNAENKLNNTV